MRVWPIVASLTAIPGFALGQPVDYSAGKTPPQLFASDCSACHHSPRGLAKGKPAFVLSGFLRSHYTTKTETADALAAYLASNSAPAANDTRSRRQGAGRGPAAEPQGTAVRPSQPVAGVDGEEDGTTPAGEAPSKRRAAVREGQKPGEPRAGAKSRAGKPDAAEAAREAAAKAEEAAKAAEEALRNKVRAYATTGDEARLKHSPVEEASPASAASPDMPTGTSNASVAAPSPASSEPGVAAAPAAPAAATPAEGAPAATDGSHSETPAAASPATAPASGERPAGTPPG